MWFEKMLKPLKTKETLLSLRILLIPASLICLNPRLTLASSEAELLDPTFILLRQVETKNSVLENLPVGDANAVVPDIEPKTVRFSRTLSQYLSPGVQFMYLSTTDVSSESEHIKTAPPATEQMPLTQKDKLLRTSMSSVTEDSNNQTKEALNNLIEQISSMKFHPKPKENKRESQKADDEKEPKKDIKESDNSTKTDAETKNLRQASTPALNSEIVQKLERIIEQSAATDEPILLADMLYQSGYYELAAYFYEIAASRDAREQTQDDKCWLMIQKAVCLSNSNPQQALQIYKGLISQYPASSWADLAKNYEGLLEWLETQQPEKLIEQCRQDLRAN